MQQITQQRMSVSQWIKVQDCEIQRNTELHALKAEKSHLKNASITHSKVSAAMLPNGSLVKLDGHTRALLWAGGRLTPPENGVLVDVYQCNSASHVNQIYKEFDNAKAAETAKDKLYGALSLNNIPMNSILIRRGGVIEAIKICRVDAYVANAEREEIYTSIKPFSAALRLIDAEHFHKSLMPGGILACLLLTVMTDGEEAFVFWRKYNNDEGIKSEKGKDGPQALTEYLLKRRIEGARQVGPRGASLMRAALATYLSYKRGHWYKAGIKQVNSNSYSFNALKAGKLSLSSSI